MDPTGDDCMFQRLGSKTQAHKWRSGQARGEEPWGQPWWVTAVLRLPERSGKSRRGGEQTDCGSWRRRAAPALDEMLTPGDLGSALESEPQEQGGSREAGALEISAEGTGHVQK